MRLTYAYTDLRIHIETLNTKLNALCEGHLLDEIQGTRLCLLERPVRSRRPVRHPDGPCTLTRPSYSRLMLMLCITRYVSVPSTVLCNTTGRLRWPACAARHAGRHRARRSGNPRCGSASVNHASPRLGVVLDCMTGGGAALLTPILRTCPNTKISKTCTSGTWGLRGRR